MRAPDVALALFLLGLAVCCLLVYRRRAVYVQSKHQQQADVLARWCVNAVLSSVKRSPDLSDDWQQELYQRLRSHFLQRLNLPFSDPVLVIFRNDLAVDLGIVLGQSATRGLNSLPEGGFRLRRFSPFTVTAILDAKNSVLIPLRSAAPRN